MPILAAEPAVYPDELLLADFIDDGARRWSVLHTKSRQEKSLARHLHDRNIPFFLPLISKRLRIRGKAVHSYLPLFGGYLFLFGDNEDQLCALNTRRVVRSLEVRDQHQLWRDLRQVHRLIASGASVSAEERLVPGAPVEIQSGPLAGLLGVIVKSASGNRFIVKVDFIERGASILLDDFALTVASSISIHD